MKYKKIEIGKWYYVRRFEYSRPWATYLMQVVQKGRSFFSQEIIMTDEEKRSPEIISPKNVLAEVIKYEKEKTNE